jgi:hypothetical protein
VELEKKENKPSKYKGGLFKGYMVGLAGFGLVTYGV